MSVLKTGNKQDGGPGKKLGAQEIASKQACFYVFMLETLGKHMFCIFSVIDIPTYSPLHHNRLSTYVHQGCPSCCEVEGGGGV